MIKVVELTIEVLGGAEPLTITLKGRTADTAYALIEAGSDGLTTLERPAPRWSDYVHSLRHVHGIDIDLTWERHGGAFPGRHGRYTLKTSVRVVSVTVASPQKTQAQVAIDPLVSP